MRHGFVIRLSALVLIATGLAACDAPNDAIQLRPPGYTPFDENSARELVLHKMSQESYESVGKPYGCKPNCRDYALGFEAAKSSWIAEGYCVWPDGPSPHSERAFQQGCDAYVEVLEARLTKQRRAHLEGNDPD